MKRMIAPWIGRLVGEMHVFGITAKELAAAAGLNEKYLSQILNGHVTPKKAESNLFCALEKVKGSQLLIESETGEK